MHLLATIISLAIYVRLVFECDGRDGNMACGFAWKCYDFREISISILEHKNRRNFGSAGMQDSLIDRSLNQIIKSLDFGNLTMNTCDSI